MYKRSSPEALSLASLGRADSKRPDRTCRGITTAGRPCRNALKKGSKEKYCHLHLDQQSTYPAKLLRAKTATMTLVEEYESESRTNVNQFIGYPTPAPSPPPPRRTSPPKKPLPPVKFPTEKSARLPSL